MKKLFIIIGVLAVIFVGMIIYKNTTTSNKNNVNVKEVENIENYISSIYMWKEITNQALPSFDNINNADDLWVWEVVKRNIEEYEIEYSQMEEKSKDLFGDEFTKQFPKEGTSGLQYDSEKDKYLATEVDLDEQEDTFLLDHIDKKDDEYIVEIIEYLEDYSSSESIIIRNIQGEEIGRISPSESETKIQEIVKNNESRFSKKRLYLNKEKITVKKVEDM